MILSFCIPTLNRAQYIGECIESVLDQWQEGFELVVVDGGSTDDTAAVVARYAKRYSGIKYFRTPVNRGIDADILEAGSRATGEYIWFLSDDDALMPGAVAHVIKALESNRLPTGASVNHKCFDSTLTFPVATVPAVTAGHYRTDHLFLTSNELFAWLGLHMGFLSAQIVKQSAWRRAAEAEAVRQAVGTCWIIAAAIGAVASEPPGWLYVHRPCIKTRTGNDSFVSRIGVLRREALTHDGFDSVIVKLFGAGSAVQTAVHLALIRERMPRTLAKLKANGASVGLQYELFRLYCSRYGKHSAFWTLVFPVFLIPNIVLRSVRRAYFGLLRSTHVANGAGVTG